jgi:phosphoribosylamine--glycine ligase
VALAAADNALVFHAGTERDGAGTWRTNGGRVLTVVGRGPDLGAARAVAEAAAGRIAWPGLQRRTDIAAALPPVPVAPVVAQAVAGSAR